MDRREFLTLTSKLAAAAAIPASLYGCGGGGGSSAATSNAQTTSAVDNDLAGVKTQQGTIDDTNSDLNTELNNDLSTNNANTNVFVRSTVNAAVAQFFETRSPNNITGDFALPVNHYLADQGNGTIWENAISAHQQAYEDYQHQTAKLIAAMRLFDYKNPNSSDANSSSISLTRASVKATAEGSLSSDESNLYSLLTDAVSEVMSVIGSNNPLSSFVLDLVSSALSGLFTYLGNNPDSIALKFLTFTSIDDLLGAITEDALSDLDFSSKGGIVLSLAKMSVASVSVLALSNINDLDETDSSNEVEFMTTFLASGDVISKLSLKWLTLAENLVTNTVTTAIGSIDNAVAMESEEEFDADSAEVTGAVNELKHNSSILAMTSFAMKALFNNLSGQAQAAATGQTGFTSGSTADKFRTLFTSAPNANDRAMSAFATTNASTIKSAALANVPDSVDAEDVTELEGNFTAAAAEAATGAAAATSAAESDAYNFALQLAEFAYEFTSQTEGDAFNFASMMAEFAYNFSMQGMEYGYDFAKQGMEYGYLFASRGEEVGVMADRILWMAVQIGVMADRIGEMADRIVYTEHLIVYTEILILDFGILIYGVIKQITNMILTGLALILDREWYSPESEDIILETISANVNTMLTNMNTYSLAVLDNQRALRESTQSAIDTINFAS